MQVQGEGGQHNATQPRYHEDCAVKHHTNGLPGQKHLKKAFKDTQEKEKSLVHFSTGKYATE